MYVLLLRKSSFPGDNLVKLQAALKFSWLHFTSSWHLSASSWKSTSLELCQVLLCIWDSLHCELQSQAEWVFKDNDCVSSKTSTIFLNWFIVVQFSLCLLFPEEFYKYKKKIQLHNPSIRHGLSQNTWRFQKSLWSWFFHWEIKIQDSYLKTHMDLIWTLFRWLCDHMIFSKCNS